jgi:peroxiredoxin
LHGIIPELKKLHASLLAISPEKPDNTLTMKEKLELPFPVLTDINGEVMRKYKVSWKLPEEIKENYIKHRNRDFTLINAGAGWELPIPATFILDRTGNILYKYVNADYMKRLEPNKILEILKTL